MLHNRFVMDIAELHLHDLSVLVRVVDAGGVTRAAEALYVSQPAVTHRLRRLERTLGARLVERDGRRLALTAVGRAVLPLARQVLQVLGEMPAAISEVQGVLRGEIVVGASTTIGEFLLPRRLSPFGRAHPHIVVRLQISNTQTIVDRVLDRSLHMGLVGLRPSHSALAAAPLGADAIVLVAAASHPLAGRRVSARDLERARLLLREEGSATRELAVRALARCGVDTAGAVGFGSNGAVRTAVLAGYGIAALSREVVRDDLALRRMVVLRLPGWHCQRRFYAVRRRDRALGAAEELLLEFLQHEDRPERKGR
jgi:DNA-binding transcriptional LysR family regulator